MHWDCIVIKIWERHNLHVMFHVAGIKRELVGAVADIAWGE